METPNVEMKKQDNRVRHCPKCNREWMGGKICPYCDRDLVLGESEPQAANTVQGQTTLSLLLDQIEQRANAATPGPWEFWESGLVIIPSTQKGVPGKIIFAASSWCEEDKCSPEEFKNCIFAASSRTDVPTLVKIVRKAILGYEVLRDMGDQAEPFASPYASIKLEELTAILTQAK